MKINTSYLGLMLASNHTNLHYVLGKKVILALRCHVAFVFSPVTHNPMSLEWIRYLYLASLTGMNTVVES